MKLTRPGLFNPIIARPSVLGFLPLCLLLCLACSDQDGPDSLPLASLVEETRIGAVHDPELALTQVGGVDVFGDSLLLVLQSIDHTVRLFDWAGNPIGRIGRGGSGPGEFRRPSSVRVVGDTVWVRDSGSSSLVLLAISGEEHARLTFPSIIVGDGTGVIRGPSGIFPDGTFLGDVNAFTPQGFRVGHDVHLPTLRVSPSGQILDTLLLRSLTVQTVIQAPEIGRPYIVLPVRDSPLVAASPESGVVVMADPFPSGHPGSFEVTMVHFLGDTLFSRRYGFSPRLIEGPTKEALIRDALPPGRESARVRTAISEALELSPYLSPVSSLSVDRDGRLWIGREEVPTEPKSWDVLSPSGEGLFRIQLPPGARFGWASGDLLWTIEEDELEVPYVVRYRIRDPVNAG